MRIKDSDIKDVKYKIDQLTEALYMYPYPVIATILLGTINNLACYMILKNERADLIKFLEDHFQEIKDKMEIIKIKRSII